MGRAVGPVSLPQSCEGMPCYLFARSYLGITGRISQQATLEGNREQMGSS